MFAQLYTIHYSLFERPLPMFYCYKSHKHEDMYGKIFEIVLKNISQRPKSITVQYDKTKENENGQLQLLAVISFILNRSCGEN